VQGFESFEEKIEYYKDRSPKEKLDWLFEANMFQKMINEEKRRELEKESNSRKKEII
jgi:hypothetical protein